MYDKIADIERFEEELREYTEVLRENSYKNYPNKIKELAEIRNIPLEELERAGIFYIGDMAEMILLGKFEGRLKEYGVISSTNNKPIFTKRYVIPIKNSKGGVKNLVGYRSDSNERYLYGTAKYYDRTDTLYGLENADEIYKSGYAILCEGITDCIHIRSIGYKHCVSSCGTGARVNSMAMLDRLRYGVITVPDRDIAGKNNMKNWEISNRSVSLYVALGYKDADEFLRDNANIEEFKEYMSACIEWITSQENQGTLQDKKEVTILR